MTFRDVIVRNFLGGIRKYIAYFLSSTLCVLFFFIYCSLVLNSDIRAKDDADVLSYVLPLTIISITFFSIFFISYAHSSFIKGRNTEFGVYISLGMHNKDLCKLLWWENLILAVGALVGGMTMGAVFSRLFQMMVVQLLGLEQIEYHLDYRAFLITVVFFSFLFALNLSRSCRKINKSDIGSLLLEARKSQSRKEGTSNFILGVVGIVIMIASIIALYFICKQEELTLNTVVLISFVAAIFSGMYLTLTFGGNFILYACRRSNYYYKNMLALTQIHHRYHQNKKVVFVLSILIAVTIFLVASPYSLMGICEDVSEGDAYTSHIVYSIRDDDIEKADVILEKYIKKEEIKKEGNVPFLLLNIQDDTTSQQVELPCISVSAYNEWMDADEVVDNGECQNLMLTWVPGDGGVREGSLVKAISGNQTYSFKVQFSGRGSFVGVSSPGYANLFIISDEDYANIQSNINASNKANFHIVYLNDWKKFKDKTIELSQELEGVVLSINAVALTYNMLKKGYATFFFLNAVLGILFFCASGSVLYFKQYTELPDTKKDFKKLFKIGISEKETKSMIGKQLKVVFFVPLLFGSFLGLCIIYLVTHIVGGASAIRPFMVNCMFVVGLYLIFQTIFYLITKRKYMSELSYLERE